MINSMSAHEWRGPSTPQDKVEELEKELLAHKLLIKALVEERNHYREEVRRLTEKA